VVFIHPGGAHGETEQLEICARNNQRLLYRRDHPFHVVGHVKMVKGEVVGRVVIRITAYGKIAAVDGDPAQRIPGAGEGVEKGIKDLGLFSLE